MFPVETDGKAYKPVSLEIVERVALVAVLVAVTAAAPTDAPDGHV